MFLYRWRIFVYIQLFTKSVYSLLKSSLKIESYVEMAKSFGMSALALTDEANVYGLIQFYKACEKAQIKPILGVSLYLPNYTLIALAKDEEGYKNVLKLATIAQLKDDLSYDMIEPYLFHLVLILPIEHQPFENLLLSKQFSMIEEHVKPLRKFQSLYIGIPFVGDNNLKTSIVELSHHLHLPLVALNEVKALDIEGIETLRYLEAIREGTHIQFAESPMNLNHHFLDPSILRLNPEEEAIINTSRIADQCNVTLDFSNLHFPKYQSPDGVSSIDYLKLLCLKGLEKRLNNTIPSNYLERLKYELQVIQNMNFSDYFLVVYDYVKYAKQHDILVGPGRGSAAGSLVAYVLGITNVDPIEYHLLFERFLNPERVSMPDIDIDFEDTRRDEIIQYVQQKYGKNHVSHIVAFGTFASRSAIREIAKVMGIPATRLNEIISYVDSTSTIEQNIEQNQSLQTLLDEFADLRKLFTIASKIEGIPRNTTTHAAGIVISGTPLTDITGLQPGLNGIYQSQFEAKDLEAVGLVKMDFLGLRNLSMLHQMVDLIRMNHHIELELSQLPFHDKETFKLIARGETTGIFQLESDGMRKVLRDIQASTFEDIVAVNALFRPGPMDNIGTYIKRKSKQEPMEFLHPDLEPILSPTYGIIVYQEQIMQIAQKIAGYTLGRADLLRRAVSKKQRQVLEEERAIFISGALNNGYEKSTAETLYDYIVKFGDYGFNRSHSVAYSLISYQLAYLKTHYPTEFMCVLLSSVVGSEGQTNRYIRECRKYGISILPVSINKSHKVYTIEDTKSIRMPLLALKGLGHNMVQSLLLEREEGEFTSYVDFVKRTRSFLKQNVFRALIYSGACDEFQLTKRAMIENYDHIIDFLRFNPSGYFDQQLTLEKVEEYSVEELMRREKELLGYYLTTHPIKTYLKTIQNRTFLLPSEALYKLDQPITIVGFVEDAKERVTKKADRMMVLTLSDETVTLSAVIFPNQYSYIHDQQKLEIQAYKLYRFQGKMQLNNQKKQFIVNNVEIISY